MAEMNNCINLRLLKKYYLKFDSLAKVYMFMW